VSVLEGGYNDRALISGTMAHVGGLMPTEMEVRPEWWATEEMLEVRPRFIPCSHLYSNAEMILRRSRSSP
jgi:acetoin utilization deacetylase AcuC-like enzyme